MILSIIYYYYLHFSKLLLIFQTLQSAFSCLIVQCSQTRFGFPCVCTYCTLNLPLIHRPPHTVPPPPPNHPQWFETMVKAAAAALAHWRIWSGVGNHIWHRILVIQATQGPTQHRRGGASLHRGHTGAHPVPGGISS